MTILHKNTVLVLNRNWQAISVTTPAQAFGQMASDAATGIDIQHHDWMVPVKWDTWLALPVREGDMSIGTSRGPVRAPTVIVCSRYADVPITLTLENAHDIPDWEVFLPHNSQQNRN